MEYQPERRGYAGWGWGWLWIILVLLVLAALFWWWFWPWGWGGGPGYRAPGGRGPSRSAPRQTMVILAVPVQIPQIR